jgi:GTP-binding protein
MPLPRIALVGAPNVGKSTLFNRLTRRRQALVANFPGLTRDVLESPAKIAGRDVILIDTGGLMPGGATPLAGKIREKVLSAASESDLLVFIVDGRQGRSPQDDDLAKLFHKSNRKVLLVANKIDGPKQELAAGDFARLGFGDPVQICAEHGEGISDLQVELNRLLPEATESIAPVEEISIAIAGRPNVGKSSLLNALLGVERALVSSVPGTTRDPIDAVMQRQGRQYRFIDTAGLRRRGKIERGAERMSAGASRRTLGRSDVTLVVLDCADGLVAQDTHVLGMVASSRGDQVRPAVVLLNKIDLVPDIKVRRAQVESIREELRFARFAPVIPISALNRLHLDRVFQAVDAVHAAATRKLSTGKLNDWLRKATEKHPPPLHGGRDVSYVFISQAPVKPPTFTILCNRELKPHFSYARYLENSLREAFDLGLTPLVLRFRKRRKGPRKPDPPQSTGE